MAASNMNMRHESQVAVEEIGAARFDPEITDTQAIAIARTTVNLFRRWQLDDAEACAVLGGMAKPEWARWKEGMVSPPELIDRELRKRMVLLMCIHWAIRTLFQDREYGYAWIRNPLKILEGKSVLDKMMKGDIANISEIRDWLYKECQLW